MDFNDRKFQLQSQLHQQYAENYNAHVTTFVTLLVAFFTMFGALGYVYAYTLDGCCGVKTVVLESSVESPVYSIQTLATLSLFVSVILCFFSYLCAMFSYIERRDQGVNWDIREEYGLYNLYENPRERGWFDYLSEFYKAFFLLFLVGQLMVLCLYFMKGCMCQRISLVVLGVVVLMLVFSLVSLLYYHKKLQKITTKNQLENTQS